MRNINGEICLFEIRLALIKYEHEKYFSKERQDYILNRIEELVSINYSVAHKTLFKWLKAGKMSHKVELQSFYAIIQLSGKESLNYVVEFLHRIIKGPNSRIEDFLCGEFENTHESNKLSKNSSALQIICKNAPDDMEFFFLPMLEALSSYGRRRKFVNYLRENNWRPLNTDSLDVYYLYLGEYNMASGKGQIFVQLLIEALVELPDEEFEESFELFRTITDYSQLKNLIEGKIQYNLTRFFLIEAKLGPDPIFEGGVAHFLKNDIKISEPFYMARKYQTEQIVDSLAYLCRTIKHNQKIFSSEGIPSEVMLFVKELASNKTLSIYKRIYLLYATEDIDACTEVAEYLMPDLIQRSSVSFDERPFVEAVLMKYFAKTDIQPVKKILSEAKLIQAIIYLDELIPSKDGIIDEETSNYLLDNYKITSNARYALSLSNYQGYENFFLDELEKVLYTTKKLKEFIEAMKLGHSTTKLDLKILSLINRLLDNHNNAENISIICALLPLVKVPESSLILDQLLSKRINDGLVIKAIGQLKASYNVKSIINYFTCIIGTKVFASNESEKYGQLELIDAHDSLLNILKNSRDIQSKDLKKLISLPDEITYSTYRQSTADTGFEIETVYHKIHVSIIDLKRIANELLDEIKISG
jgi:hypothetical protein